MATFVQSYAEAQTDLAVITPSESLGEKIYLWQVILTAENGAELNFLTSAVQVAKVDGSGSLGISNPDKSGIIGEPLSLTCGANATVKVMYDKI